MAGLRPQRDEHLRLDGRSGSRVPFEGLSRRCGLPPLRQGLRGCAKPAGWTLRGVETRSDKYLKGLPRWCPPSADRCRSATKPPVRPLSPPTFWSPKSAAARSSPSTAPRSSSAWWAEDAGAGSYQGDAATHEGRLVAGPDRGDTEPRMIPGGEQAALGQFAAIVAGLRGREGA